MKALGITSKSNLESIGAEKLAAIVKESSKDFRLFYQFAYKFYAEGKKFISTEIALQLWSLIFNSKYKIIKSFGKFLEKEEIQTISFD